MSTYEGSVNATAIKTLRTLLFVSSIIVCVLALLSIAVSSLFSIGIVVVAVGCALYSVFIFRPSVERIESQTQCITDHSPTQISKNEDAVSAHVDPGDPAFVAMREKVAVLESEMRRCIDGQDRTIKQVFGEFGSAIRRNDEVLDRIRTVNDTFTGENKIVKDLVKKIADNVDMEISFSRNTLERLEKLFAFINGIISAAGTLRADSEFLMSLMRTLEDISNQIHILAINNSIIASRYGETGKAFMVVAKDQRNLSDSVKKSVEEMKLNSEKLQNSIGAVTANIQQIDAETKVAHEALGSLLMRFEGLNLSINIIEKKIDANTDIIKNMKTIIMHDRDGQAASPVPDENASCLDLKRMMAGVIGLLEELNKVS